MNYKDWLAEKSIPKDVFIKNLFDGEDGFVINVVDGSGLEYARITFPVGSFIAYRCTNETYRSDLNIRTKGGGLLSVVENSDYINWLKETSGGISDTVEVTHYLVTTSEEYIDVLSKLPPDMSEA